METRPLSRHPPERGAKKFLKPALALAFLVGSVFCTNAWADRGGPHHDRHGHHGLHQGQHHGHHGHHRGHHRGHHHSRGHVGVVIGAPLYWGSGWHGDPYYGYPYSYRYRPPVVVPEPPVYIERGVTPASALWYFCGNPEGYYPYVKQCSMPWRTVTPQSVRR
jgi:hypothetical protein